MAIYCVVKYFPRTTKNSPIEAPYDSWVILESDDTTPQGFVKDKYKTSCEVIALQAIVCFALSKFTKTRYMLNMCLKCGGKTITPIWRLTDFFPFVNNRK